MCRQAEVLRYYGENRGGVIHSECIIPHSEPLCNYIAIFTKVCYNEYMILEKTQTIQ